MTAHLASPLAEDVPKLDALLTWKAAHIIGWETIHRRSDPLPADVPLPLAWRKLAGINIWCCSDPIYRVEHTWREFYNKRFEPRPEYVESSRLRKINHATGPYKSLRKPMTIRRIPSVTWFALGQRKDLMRFLKQIPSIGALRKQGFGIISDWEVEEVEQDHSVESDGVLMRTVPLAFAESLTCRGWRKGYGACRPPYWHPGNYMEVAVPC